jgi:DNA-binding transcriptional LysR family regulator
LITYHAGYTGRTRIDIAFAQAGLRPDIVMSALDADVIKTYVELGLGIGIVASMAFNPEKDGGLRRLDSAHVGYWHDFGHAQIKHNLGLLNHAQWLAVGVHTHTEIRSYT